MKNKALPGNLERMNKFQNNEHNPNHHTFRENMSKWLHSVMKQSPANTQIQNIILPVWLQLDKTKLSFNCC